MVSLFLRVGMAAVVLTRLGLILNTRLNARRRQRASPGHGLH